MTLFFAFAIYFVILIGIAIWFNKTDADFARYALLAWFGVGVIAVLVIIAIGIYYSIKN